MALNWTENQEIRIQRASSLWAHGGSDLYAKRDNREYSIAKDEEDDQKWHFAMRAAGQLADVGLFSSLDAAKQRAEEHERIERNGRYEDVQRRETREARRHRRCTEGVRRLVGRQ